MAVWGFDLGAGERPGRRRRGPAAGAADFRRPCKCSACWSGGRHVGVASAGQLAIYLAVCLHGDGLIFRLLPGQGVRTVEWHVIHQ